MMKRTLLLTVMSLMLFVSCSIAANKPSEQKSVTPSVIEPDEVVKKMMGDSIAEIVFNPKVVNVYKLAPSSTPSDNDRTIGGVKVEKVFGKLAKNIFPIVQFLLSDSLAYSNEVIVPAVPFRGLAAIEFKQKKESVFLIFSFISGEVSAVKNGKEVWHYHVSDNRKYALFFYKVTHDKDIEFFLKK